MEGRHLEEAGDGGEGEEGEDGEGGKAVSGGQEVFVWVSLCPSKRSLPAERSLGKHSGGRGV